MATLPERLAAPLERRVAIPARDGLLLGASLFEPARPAGERRALFIAAATGVTRGRYHRFARYLAQCGWSVVTFDYRGIGDSRHGPTRALTHTAHDWGAEDIAGVIGWIEAEWRPARLAAVTHSVGAQLLPLAHNQARVDALVTVGAPRGYWRLWDGAQAYVCLALFRAVPILVRLFGYMPMRLAGCEDLPPAAAREWSRWGLQPDLVDAGGASLAPRYAAFSAPILAFSFADDIYAPRRAVARLLAMCGNAPHEHRHIHPRQLGVDELGHSGFFVDAACAPLWDEAAAWLEQAGAAATRPTPAARPPRGVTWSMST